MSLAQRACFVQLGSLPTQEWHDTELIMARRGHTCPTCHKKVQMGDKDPYPPTYPFCSERCKLLDLGSWLDGRYRIISSLKPDGSPAPEDEGG